MHTRQPLKPLILCNPEISTHPIPVLALPESYSEPLS
jgi:hypothetical protein